MQPMATTGFTLAAMVKLPVFTVTCHPAVPSQAGPDKPSSTRVIAASLAQVDLQGAWTHKRVRVRMSTNKPHFL